MKACIVIITVVLASAQAGFLNGGIYGHSGPLSFGYGTYAPSFYPTTTISVAPAPIAFNPTPIVTYSYSPSVVRKVHYTPKSYATVVNKAPVYSLNAVSTPTYYTTTYSHAPSYASSFTSFLLKK